MSQSCTNVVRKMEQATLITFELLLHFPLEDSIQQLKAIREDIMLLETITINRLTPFSAADFFNIDFTTIFTIISSVSSVVILVMQGFH
jgi:hypothetical protein